MPLWITGSASQGQWEARHIAAGNLGPPSCGSWRSSGSRPWAAGRSTTRWPPAGSPDLAPDPSGTAILSTGGCRTWRARAMRWPRAGYVPWPESGHTRPLGRASQGAMPRGLSLRVFRGTCALLSFDLPDCVLIKLGGIFSRPASPRGQAYPSALQSGQGHPRGAPLGSAPCAVPRGAAKIWERGELEEVGLSQLPMVPAFFRCALAASGGVVHGGLPCAVCRGSAHLRKAGQEMSAQLPKEAMAAAPKLKRRWNPHLWGKESVPRQAILPVPDSGALRPPGAGNLRSHAVWPSQRCPGRPETGLPFHRRGFGGGLYCAGPQNPGGGGRIEPPPDAAGASCSPGLTEG